jgi:hypothetical protein
MRKKGEGVSGRRGGMVVKVREGEYDPGSSYVCIKVEQ